MIYLYIRVQVQHYTPMRRGSHCKAVEAKLVFASPFRANRPLKNAAELEGAPRV